MRPILFLQVLYASATWRQYEVRPRYVGFVVFREIVDGQKCLPQQAAELCLELRLRHARLQAADHVKPVGTGVVYIRNVRQYRHRFNGQIEIGRSAGEPVSVEALRRDAGNGHRLGIHKECAADDRAIASIAPRPRLVAHDGGDGCALHIV